MIEIKGCNRWANVSALRGPAAQEALRELRVSGCTYPAEDHLSVSFTRSYYPNLRILRLDGPCHAESVVSLLVICPSLRDLRLSGSNLNEHCLPVRSSRIQVLEVLMLLCADVTMPKLSAVAAQCPDLKVLSLWHCQFAEMEACTAEHCKQLEGLC